MAGAANRPPVAPNVRLNILMGSRSLQRSSPRISRSKKVALVFYRMSMAVPEAEPVLAQPTWPS
jgi:hypothetical protein